jgi:histidyl-tRNA synthetase
MLVTFFEGIGLTAKDIVIRVSSRKVLEEVLGSLDMEGDIFAQTCIIVDKMDKLSSDVIEDQLSNLGHDSKVVMTIQTVLGIKDMNSLKEALKDESVAVSELNLLFDAIDSYGISEWVEFDASIVRGLAYYTGPVFEAHDRTGNLRAICGGGRYDKLIGTLGGSDLPATGFGFGDMVVMELLDEKGLLPELESEIEDVVFGMGTELRGAAMQVAGALRTSGRSVDLVLEDKKIKWAIKHADKIGAERLVLLAPEEWSRKKIKIRDLKTGEESEISISEL